jgi:enterochelin esterase-like enzyme
MPRGTRFEYKFTLGSWDREEVRASGNTPPNHRLEVESDREVLLEVHGFKQSVAECIQAWEGSGVLGRLVYWTNVSSAHLKQPRHVVIWLPPGYDDAPGQHHAVLYMQDGQNLFDPRIASTGVDWGVDEAIVRGMNEGRIPPTLVVGVWSTRLRGREYSPWDLGPAYARFLTEELMPRVDGAFRTRTGAEDTAVMGSSMGGLISFFLCWQYPQQFGLGGCLSTHFPYSAATLARFRGQPVDPRSDRNTPLIDEAIAEGATFPRSVRIYMDHGTLGHDSGYEAVTRRVGDWLTAQGLARGRDFMVKKFPGADHNETAWRSRLDEPLTFLLAD